MKHWIKRIFLTGYWGFLALVWIVVGLFYYQASRPASESNQATTFEVQPGMTLKQVARELSRQGLIRSANAFQAIAYIQNKQKQVMVGEFSLSPSMPPSSILLRITSGKTVLHPVTIPEGYRITEIAALLHSEGLIDKETFIQQTRDENLVRSLGIPADSLEGYLFPETYHFSKFTPEKRIVQTMIDDRDFQRTGLKTPVINECRKKFSFLARNHYAGFSDRKRNRVGLGTKNNLIRFSQPVKKKHASANRPNRDLCYGTV